MKDGFLDGFFSYLDEKEIDPSVVYMPLAKYAQASAGIGATIANVLSGVTQIGAGLAGQAIPVLFRDIPLTALTAGGLTGALAAYLSAQSAAQKKKYKKLSDEISRYEDIQQSLE